MKFIVLGGAGEVGSVVVKDLASVSGVEEVCIGDINYDAAKEMSAQLGPRVSARIIDINNTSDLVQTLKGHDVVVNCVGPFYKNGSKVLEACIESKVNYVDICDDYDAAELFLEFNKKCEKAGITAIICHGASPGITNMCGLLGASKMEPEEIHTAWVESMTDASGVVVLWHGAHMSHGEVPQFINGEWVKVPALSGAEEKEFMDPLGKYPVYYVGHSEPITMPRYIKGLKSVTNKGNMWPAELDLVALIKPFSDFGLIDTDTITINGVEIVKRDFMIYHFMDILGELLGEEEGTSEEDIHFMLRVDVTGTIGKARAHYAYTAKMDTSEGTGWSASYGAQAIATGKISIKGVFAPEGCEDPKDFFKHLSTKGIHLYETQSITERFA